MIEKIVVAVLAALVTAFSFWSLGKLVTVPQALIIPSGAVTAFSAQKCPDGWDPYALADSRSIVGIPTSSSVAVGHQNGSSQVVLRDVNLPRHQHDTALGILPSFIGWGQGPGKTAIAGSGVNTYATALSAPFGEEKPTPIMIEPPTVHLRYCIKK